MRLIADRRVNIFAFFLVFYFHFGIGEREGEAPAEPILLAFYLFAAQQELRPPTYSPSHIEDTRLFALTRCGEFPMDGGHGSFVAWLAATVHLRVFADRDDRPVGRNNAAGIAVGFEQGIGPFLPIASVRHLRQRAR